ncbi:hypothetical protein [Bacillus cereus group sp. BfR-BA-01445]|uniref:hypothetical protein n=1 Tax=Bacillus cereus group sp. BfR-BA-01445 TaxID=2920349 RepID=UPI001F588F26|nr:hypothetical protein [Bacillus cereus group sp. BfR-BA-01445]
MNISLHIPKQININEVNVNIVPDYMYSFVQKLLNTAASNDLNIEDLTDIYFTSDYKKEIQEFNKKHNLDVTVTDDENYGQGFGINIGYFNEQNEVKCAIFYDSLVSQLFYVMNINQEPFPTEQINQTFNIVYHELVHCHDETIFRNLIMNLTNDEGLRYRKAHNIWAEYIANFYAGLTYSYRKIEEIKDSFIKNVETINNNYDVPTGLLMISHDIGNLHSQGVRLEDIVEQNEEYDYYFELEELLIELLEDYSNWSDITVFDKMINSLNNYFN